jgi:hypothetical protein
MGQTNTARLHAPIDGIAAPTVLSRRAVYAGRVLSGLVIVFLLFDAALQVLKVQAAVEGTVKLGYPESVILASTKL